MALTNKKQLRVSRHKRVRAVVSGTAARPRMNIFRSLNHIYVQFIDDQKGHTLASASTKEIKSKATKVELATQVGKIAAEKAIKAGISAVVFDRGGYQYHGRIKSVAEGARAAGLKF